MIIISPVITQELPSAAERINVPAIFLRNGNNCSVAITPPLTAPSLKAPPLAPKKKK